MKVPSCIKDNIIQSAKYRTKANELNALVREWLTDNNLYNDSVIDQLIDSTEIGCVPQKFIDYLENDQGREGNEY
ncbi:MAG TPA: hypothetical protein VMV86_06230 [Methanosarcinales archaeon]|nr:hypothetical protein [Methanosarcinales archaeon]